jgi:hypothetical protein
MRGPEHNSTAKFAVPDAMEILPNNQKILSGPDSFDGLEDEVEKQ